MRINIFTDDKTCFIDDIKQAGLTYFEYFYSENLVYSYGEPTSRNYSLWNINLDDSAFTFYFRENNDNYNTYKKSVYEVSNDAYSYNTRTGHDYYDSTKEIKFKIIT